MESNTSSPFLSLFLKNYEVLENDDEINNSSPQHRDFVRDQMMIQAPLYVPNAYELSMLNGTNWISDDVISWYLTLLKSNSPKNVGTTNTFFFSSLERDQPNFRDRWEGFHVSTLPSFEQFLIPIKSGSHWIMINLNFQAKEMWVYDPLGNEYPKECNLLNQYLTHYKIENLPERYIPTPKQTNGYDCGVFLMQTARSIFFNNGVFNFSQSDMPFLRKRIQAELESMRLF